MKIFTVKNAGKYQGKIRQKLQSLVIVNKYISVSFQNEYRLSMPFHGCIVVIKRSGADGSTFPLVNEVIIYFR